MEPSRHALAARGIQSKGITVKLSKKAAPSFSYLLEKAKEARMAMNPVERLSASLDSAMPDKNSWGLEMAKAYYKERFPDDPYNHAHFYTYGKDWLGIEMHPKSDPWSSKVVFWVNMKDKEIKIEEVVK